MDEVSPAVAVPFRPFPEPQLEFTGIRSYCNGESRVSLPESSCSGSGSLTSDEGAMNDSYFEINNTRQDSLSSSSSSSATAGLPDVTVDISAGEEINGSDEFDPRSTNQSEKKVISRTESRSLFEFKSVPLYGVTSICGRRPEMEDSVSTIPRFLQVSSNSLLDGRVTNGFNPHMSAHFFGVYDGHGGSQV